MAIAITIWLIGAMFTAGYFYAMPPSSKLKWWQEHLIQTACLFMWPAFLGISFSVRHQWH